MFRAETMIKVNILALAGHVTELTRVLGRSGILHLIDATAQSNHRLFSEAVQTGDDQIVTMALYKVKRLLQAFGLEEEEESHGDWNPQEDMSLDHLQQLVNRIADRYQEQADAMDQLLRKAGLEGRKLDMIKRYPLQSVSLETLHNLTRFYMAVGKLAKANQPRAQLVLGEKAIVISVAEDSDSVLVLAPNKHRVAVQEQLSKLGFSPMETPEGKGTATEAAEESDVKLKELGSGIEACRLAIMQLSEQYGSLLLLLREKLKEFHAVHEAQRHFGKVSRLYGISGWMPEERLPELRAIVEKATDGSGVVEVIPADADEAVRAGTESVPVKLKGGALAHAFQLLICNFGIPNYREIDPTLFVGLTFTLFFGYMFGDVGQGLVLLLGGLWAFFSRNKKVPRIVHDAGPLLVACGASAVAFGFAYGSFFGYEDLLPHLWVNPLKDTGIMRLLITAVSIGVVVSSVAVIINIINHFLAKKYFEGVFDRFGVLGLLFYWAALGSGLWVILAHGHFCGWMAALILLPLCLLAIRGPVRHFLKPQEESEGLVNMLLECILEMMETITGYMSGTVSFVRVGAFAISHAALCLAVFSIVKMLRNVPGGVLWGILVIVLGNALVICFEGMVAMIQGVRLEYYELFGKFYSGDGVEFKPFTLGRESKS